MSQSGKPHARLGVGFRAQATADFFIIAALVLLIGIAFLGVYMEKVQSADIAMDKLSAQSLADNLARGINTVSIGANGSFIGLDLPESLPGGAAYNISFRGAGRRIEIFWEGSGTMKSVAASLLNSNMTDLHITKTKGSGITAVNVTNVNGAVKLDV